MTKKMPNEWRRSVVVPICKNKEDIQNCTNYRWIKLLSHIMKLWESNGAKTQTEDQDI